MKKIYLLLVALFSLTIANAQKGRGEGTILIDAFYGAPNLLSSYVKNAYNNNSTTQINDFKVTSTGPFGVKGEYMITDKIGLGLIFNYANTSVKWSEVGTNSNNVPTLYSYKVMVPRTRFLGSFNFHFGHSEKFDPFLIIGAGYAIYNAQSSSNDPKFTSEKVNGTFPVAIRAGFGTRYFFTDNVGVNFEIALGGPLLQFGLSFKI